MRYVTFLFCLLCLFIVASGASAQDGGVDSGDTESLDPLAACLRDCSAVNEMCVTTAAVPNCISTVPSCAGMAPRSAEIIAAFCEACGGATVGCGVDDPAVAGTAGTPRDPSASSSAPLTDASGERPRAPTAAERERTDMDRARGICRRQRGVWDPAPATLMPDGRAVIGICRTPEGIELAQMIEDEHDARTEEDERLGRRITAEERARSAADTIHDTDIAVIQAGDRARDGRIATLLAEVACVRSHADRIPISRLDGETQRVLRDTRMEHDGYFICGSYTGDLPDDAVASSSSSSTRPRRPDEHPTLFHEGSGVHVRLQLFGHIGFSPIHPTLAQVRGNLETLPSGLGFDATVFAPISNGWYVEGGAGLTYDWPDFQPYATNARLWYHAGLSAFVHPVLSIGFGFLGSERFRPNIQSAYSLYGGYLDLTLHFRMRLEGREIRGSDDVTDPAFVITLRGAAGAAIRPAAAVAPDGDIQLMAGVEF